MDKTTGFALLGFLCIVLATGWSQSMSGGGGGGGGGGVMAAMSGGGGGGGGGGGICGAAIAKMRQCQGVMLAEVPEQHRAEAAAQFESKMADAMGDCQRELEKHPDDAAKVQACLALPDCESFFRCL